MKTLKMNFALLTIIIFGLQCMNAGNRNINCLDVSVTAVYHKDVLENCKISLIEDNSVIQTLDKPNRGNKYKLTLQSNSHYTIIISCEGFHKRKISIDTSIPDSISLAMIFEFCARVEMIPVSVQLSGAFEDHPVAIVSYDNKNDVFNMNKKYTKNVKKAVFKPESLYEEQGVTPEYNYSAK